jgi:WD40 repeat protein
VLVAAAFDDFSVRVWDLDEQQMLHTLQVRRGAERWWCWWCWWCWHRDVLTALCMLPVTLRPGLIMTYQSTSQPAAAGTSTPACSCPASLPCLQGHSGWVVSVRFLGRSHKLITGSHDCTARVWDAWAGTCLATLEGHTGRINRVAVDEEGTVAVTASDDNTCRVWDVARSGQCTAVLEGHSAWLNDVVVAKDCRSIVTVSGDGTGMVWDASSGQCLKTLEGHGGEALSVVLTSKGRFAVTGSADCTARVWDLQAPHIALAAKHRGAVKSVQVGGRGLCFCASVLLCCRACTAGSQHVCVVLHSSSVLPCCPAALLPCCPAALLPCCPAALLPCCPLLVGPAMLP